MKLIICLLQCFNQIFHFNLTVYSRAKIIFFTMGILTELLPMTNLLIPPPNPAHTPEEEEGLPQQDYCWRFISWWGILVLITNHPWWLSHSVGVWYTLGSRVRTSNRELKWCQLDPYHHFFFVFHSTNCKCFQ